MCEDDRGDLLTKVLDTEKPIEWDAVTNSPVRSLLHPILCLNTHIRIVESVDYSRQGQLSTSCQSRTFGTIGVSFSLRSGSSLGGGLWPGPYGCSFRDPQVVSSGSSTGGKDRHFRIALCHLTERK